MGLLYITGTGDAPVVQYGRRAGVAVRLLNLLC